MEHTQRTSFKVAFGIVAFLLGILFLTSGPVQALPAYALQQWEAGKHSASDEDWSILWVYNRDTGRTVWSRRCSGAYSPSWSQDHRSFAIVIGNLYAHPRYRGQFRLLYWRAGHAVRLVTHPGLFADFDEAINMRWSPDGRRFAFLGGSTAFDSGGPYSGCLCCVDAVTGHFFFGPSEVGHYRWVDARRMRYLATRLVRDKSPNHADDILTHVAERPHYWTGNITYKNWEALEWLRGKVRLHGRLWPW